MRQLNPFPILRAYRYLIRFDAYLRRGQFSAVHEAVRSHPVRETLAIPNAEVVACSAIDLACVCYWKNVLCLQRAAATCCLLKQLGVPAELVIGAQLLPFRAHAWVEVSGRVVNDKPFVVEAFGVLERV